MDIVGQQEVDRDQLIPRDRDHLRGSGLTDETIRRAGVYSLRSPADVAQALGRSWVRGGGIAFPVFLPGESKPDHIRVRPHEPKMQGRDGKERPRRYEGPRGRSPVYFSPRARAQQWTDEILVVEGEKKALLLDQLGYAAIGLIGCWQAHDKPHKDKTGKWRLHPWIRAYVPVSGHQIVVVADADASVNPDIAAAVRKQIVMFRTAGAEVRVVHVPDSGKKKNGIDDFFVRAGEEATRALLKQSHAEAGVTAVDSWIQQTVIEIGDTAPRDGEPVVLYLGRNRQTPVFRYWPLPGVLSMFGLGSARTLLLARIARLADDDGVAHGRKTWWYDDATAMLGTRGLARALGLRSPGGVLKHLRALEQAGYIDREHQCGAARLPDTITIRPFIWHYWGCGGRWFREDIRRTDVVPDHVIEHIIENKLAIKDDWACYTVGGKRFERLHHLTNAIRADEAWARATVHEAVASGTLADQLPIRCPPDRYWNVMHVPEALVALRLVSHQAALVYTRIVWRNGSLGPRPLDRHDLAEYVGLSSTDGLRRYLRELYQVGLLSRLPNGRFVPLMHEWLRSPGALIDGKTVRRWSG